MKTSNDSAMDRVPLVINWHTRFKGLASILHRNYQTMLEDHARLAQIFPKPPIVSYRRNPNLRSILVSCQPRVRRSSGPSIRYTQKNTKKRGRPCKLCKLCKLSHRTNRPVSKFKFKEDMSNFGGFLSVEERCSCSRVRKA